MNDRSDPVIGIDVTEDGSYILATTASYLLLIPTLLSSGKTGFQAAMGAQKPTPIKLQLLPLDLVKYNIRSVNFTPAHFNTGANINEEWIVASTGPFLLLLLLLLLLSSSSSSSYSSASPCCCHVISCSHVLDCSSPF